MTDPRDEESGSDVTVVDAPARHRFEVVVGEQVGFLDYRREGETLTLVHTEVPRELRGRGLGEALARFALEHARTHGLRVVPACPFVADYVREHPEFAPLVAP
jgi:predicted GNAT family acetyltransferase